MVFLSLRLDNLHFRLVDLFIPYGAACGSSSLEDLLIEIEAMYGLVSELISPEPASVLVGSSNPHQIETNSRRSKFTQELSIKR